MNRFKIFLTVIGITTLLLISMICTGGIQTTFGSSKFKTTEMQSEITPFNITTQLRWTPYMADNIIWYQQILDEMPLHGPFGLVKGVELPLYSTLLPMTTNITELKYSIKVVQLTGPSNITVTMKFEHKVYDGLGGVQSNDIINTVNTEINKSVTGTYLFNTTKILRNSDSSYFSYDYILENVTKHYAYSKLTIQPLSNDKNVPWSHNLTVEITMVGKEDRKFLNYMRAEHGLSALEDSYFKPYSNPESIFTEMNKQSYYYEPLSQPALSNYAPSQIIYLGNETSFSTKTLDVKIHTNATKDFKITFSATRGLYTKSTETQFSCSIGTPIIQSESDLRIQIPWERFSWINKTVYSRNETTGALNTSFGQYPLNPGEFYQIFNVVKIRFESIHEPWNMWLTTKVEVNWLENITIPDNIIQVSLDQKDYQLNATGKNNYFFDLGELVQTTATESTIISTEKTQTIGLDSQTLLDLLIALGFTTKLLKKKKIFKK